MKLTNKEIAQKAMERYQELTRRKDGRKGYWMDQDELNRDFFEGLRRQQQNDAYLYWLAGSGNQISKEQEKELQWQLEFNPKTPVIIPLNHGGVHWDFAVFERDANGVLQAYKVNNVGIAGLCGKRTVDQSLEIIKVGVQAFAKQNPGLVRKVDAQDKIYQPVQRILNKANGVSQQQAEQPARSEVKSYSPNQPRDYALERGIAENERFLRDSNPFEFELGKKAHADIALRQNRQDIVAKRDLEKSETLLVKMFVSMTPQEQAFTINRLMSSDKLSKEESVSKMINSLLTARDNAVKPTPETKPAPPQLGRNGNCFLATASKANSTTVKSDVAGKPASGPQPRR